LFRVFRVFRGSRVIRVVRAFRGKKEKPRRHESAGLQNALWLSSGYSVAHVDRPAEAGMMVPVVVRETEHPA
jgi:hypothetical protein